MNDLRCIYPISSEIFFALKTLGISLVRLSASVTRSRTDFDLEPIRKVVDIT